MDTYRNFIGGKWVESISAKTVNNVNPADTDDIIGTVRQPTRQQRPAGVDAARGGGGGGRGYCPGFPGFDSRVEDRSGAGWGQRRGFQTSYAHSGNSRPHRGNFRRSRDSPWRPQSHSWFRL